jgi:hypothetical protein
MFNPNKALQSHHSRQTPNFGSIAVKSSATLNRSSW